MCPKIVKDNIGSESRLGEIEHWFCKTLKEMYTGKNISLILTSWWSTRIGSNLTLFPASSFPDFLCYDLVMLAV